VRPSSFSQVVASKNHTFVMLNMSKPLVPFDLYDPPKTVDWFLKVTLTTCNDFGWFGAGNGYYLVK
jgi:hypothetical protein